MVINGLLKFLFLALFMIGLSSVKVQPGTVSDHPHILYGLPRGTPKSNDLISRKIYTLSSNDETKLADWVAYVVKRSNFDCKQKTSRIWKSDPDIDPDQTLEPADYKGAYKALSTDRGHQAPLASFKCTDHWKELNYLSNITPQKSALNQGAWAKLENKVRKIVKKSGNDIYVITGPLYEREMRKLPQADEFHKLPSGYWKILLDTSSTTPETWKATGFIFDQKTPRQNNFMGHIVSIDAIEKRTGLDFLYDLDDAVENDIEAQQSWPWID